MSHRDGSVKVVLIAAVVNFFVTLAKSVGWMFSMSPSMLAEAIHSFEDAANQLLVYLGYGFTGKVPPVNILPDMARQLMRWRSKYKTGFQILNILI